jgi:hypothetical protein
MQHLPLPKNSSIGTIDIPLLSRVQYDGASFAEYPARQGWSTPRVGRPQRATTVSATASLSSDNCDEFLQTWLYFGLLHDYLAISPSLGLFETISVTGDRLLTTAQLEALVVARTVSLRDEYVNGGQARVKLWMHNIYDTLLVARDHVLRLIIPEASPDKVVSLLCLSVAVLAEYLMQALKNLYIAVGLETPVQQRWRVIDDEINIDCGQPIVELMLERGWCPQELAQFERLGSNSVGELWFIANLEPPRQSMSHTNCDAEICQHLQVEKSEYKLHHVCDNQDCAAIGPDRMRLDSIVHDGNLALVKLQSGKNANEMKIAVEPYAEGGKFVAVSHVWADGRGNPCENKLPTCVLQQIQSLVDRLPGIGATGSCPFWIDTLCVPREPRSLRDKALERLRDPYVLAIKTLVIDGYLERQEASGASSTELIARVNVCGWTQRLWTFQEGRLPKHVWFSFKDKCVNLYKEVDRWRDTFSRIPPLASHEVELMVISNHTATMIYPGIFDAVGVSSVTVLRGALKTRSTSVQTDEALCLASILDLDMKSILDAPPEARMKAFWSLVPKVPTGLALSRARRKLPMRGFRWAPESFMGQMRQADWGGPLGVDSAYDARLTAHGLVVSLPALLFAASQGPESTQSKQRLMNALQETESEILLHDDQGRWFVCTTENDWHQALPPLDARDHPVILMDRSLKFGKDSMLRVTHDFQVQGSQKGVIAFHRSDFTEGGVVQVKAYRHILLQMLSRKQHEILDLLQKLVHNISLEGKQTLDSLPHGSKEADNFKEELVIAGLKESSGLEIMHAIQEARGRPHDTKLATSQCANWFSQLYRLGPWTAMHFSHGPLEWCVD